MSTFNLFPTSMKYDHLSTFVTFNKDQTKITKLSAHHNDPHPTPSLATVSLRFDGAGKFIIFLFTISMYIKWPMQPVLFIDMKTRRIRITMNTFHFLVRKILSTEIFATTFHNPSMLKLNFVNISQHSIGMRLLSSLIPRLPYHFYTHPRDVLNFFFVGVAD